VVVLHSTKTATLTHILLELGRPGGSVSKSLTVKVGDEFNIIEMLYTVTPQNTPSPIGGASITIQVSNDHKIGSLLTRYNSSFRGIYGGIRSGGSTAFSPGNCYFEATYSGDSQYAPTQSNVATLAVTQ
jgi:hypothetical protein